MKVKTGLAVSLLLLTSCVTTNVARLGSGDPYKPVPVESVAVYRTAEQVPGKYEEVGLLNSKGGTGWSNEAEMVGSMRNAAAKMGANAIILDSITEPGAGAKVAAAIFGTGAERTGRAIAIRILAPVSGAAVASEGTAPPVPAPTR